LSDQLYDAATVVSEPNGQCLSAVYEQLLDNFMPRSKLKGAAEILQEAKDAFRASVGISSSDGYSSVWPVVMDPADWAQALGSSFAQANPAENPDNINMMIQDKSNTLRMLTAQLDAHSDAEDEVMKLKRKVEEMGKILEVANADLHSKYSETTIALAKVGANDKLAALVKDKNPNGTVEDMSKQLTAVCRTFLRTFVKRSEIRNIVLR
jgi:predicted DNA-binding ArsR family transcriptional regulator